MLATARPVQMYTSNSSRLNAKPSVAVRQTTTVAHTTIAVHRTTRSHLLRRVGSWVSVSSTCVSATDDWSIDDWSIVDTSAFRRGNHMNSRRKTN